MSWQVVEHMTIYHKLGMYALSPTVTRLPSGNLLVTFQRAPHLGYAHHQHPLFNVQSCRSEDEGQTWSEARLITANPFGAWIEASIHSQTKASSYTPHVPNWFQWRRPRAMEQTGPRSMVNLSGYGPVTMGIPGVFPNAFRLCQMLFGDIQPSIPGSVGVGC